MIETEEYANDSCWSLKKILDASSSLQRATLLKKWIAMIYKGG